MDYTSAHFESNLNLMFETSPIGVIVMNEDFTINRMNANALEILEIDNEKDRDYILGKRFGDGFCCRGSLKNQSGCGYGEDCQDCVLNKAATSVRESGQALTNLEVNRVFMRKGGETELWFRASITPITDRQEKCFVLSLVDITDTKRNERAILRARDASLHLMDSFPALLWRTDRDGKRDYVNRAWLEFTGLTLEESLGYGWFDSLHPEDIAMAFEVFEHCRRNMNTFEVEYRLQRHDGEYRHCLSRGKPYYDLDGAFAGYTGAVFDITDRRLAEEAQKRYQVLFENARDIILFINEKGLILDANQAALNAYGYTREELLSSRIFDLRSEPLLVLEQMVRALEKGNFFETVHIRKDGSQFPVEVNAKGIKLGNKSVLVSIIRDITERKQIELQRKRDKEELQRAKEKAEAANRAKSEFLANMSHEIRTPINGIVGMIDLTLLTQLECKQKENLEIAKSCAYSLFKIINDILDFSKMEAGKLVIEDIDVNLKELVEETLKAHAQDAEKKGLELNYSLSATLPECFGGDPNRIRQVLNNLLNNAIKFTNRGEVKLSIKRVPGEREGSVLKFTITDTGIGISEEEQLKLFKEFSQVDGSITRKYGGTGLGLAISKKLVEMMDGRIWVESEYGKGSSFCFTLSLRSHENTTHLSPQGEKKEVLKATNSSESYRILLAEDHKVNVMVLSEMLKGKGHWVDTAMNGEEALALHAQNHYEAILMDIHMPLMDGIEATRRIREREGVHKHTPIIALTADALKGDRERFLKVGMDEYIPKPVMMEELFMTLNEVVEKNRSEKAKLDVLESELGLTDEGIVLSQQKKSLSAENMISRIQESSQDIKKLGIATKSGDLVAVEHIAHRLKKSFIEIDADNLKTLAFKIELAARRGDLEGAMAHQSVLEREFEIYKKTLI